MAGNGSEQSGLFWEKKKQGVLEKRERALENINILINSGVS